MECLVEENVGGALSACTGLRRRWRYGEARFGEGGDRGSSGRARSSSLGGEEVVAGLNRRMDG